MTQMDRIKDIAVIIAAGGSGTRFGNGNKLLAQIHGEAVFTHCLRALTGSGVHFVIATNDRDALETALPPNTDVTWVPGGATRTASVGNAVKAIADSERVADYIAVHDAARPFATYDLLRQCLAQLESSDADGVVAAHHVTDTIHQVNADGMLVETPQRDLLWAAETPQIFRGRILIDAYRSWENSSEPKLFSDDASLVHWAFPNARISFLRHPLDNRKITFPQDL